MIISYYLSKDILFISLQLNKLKRDKKKMDVYITFYIS